MMRKEYKVSSAGFWMIFLPFAFYAFIILIIMLSKKSTEGFQFLAFMAIICSLILVIRKFLVRKAVFVIDDEAVYSITIFGEKKIMIKDIKGYRIHKATIIESITGEKIVLQMTYQNRKEMEKWFKENCKEL